MFKGLFIFAVPDTARGWCPTAICAWRPLFCLDSHICSPTALHAGRYVTSLAMLMLRWDSERPVGVRRRSIGIWTRRTFFGGNAGGNSIAYVDARCSDEILQEAHEKSECFALFFVGDSGANLNRTYRTLSSHFQSSSTASLLHLRRLLLTHTIPAGTGRIGRGCSWRQEQHEVHEASILVVAFSASMRYKSHIYRKCPIAIHICSESAFDFLRRSILGRKPD